MWAGGWRRKQGWGRTGSRLRGRSPGEGRAAGVGWRGGYHWKGPEKVAKAGSGRGLLPSHWMEGERVAAFPEEPWGAFEGARVRQAGPDGFGGGTGSADRSGCLEV